jgi:cysteine-rich repeat protein
MRGRSNVVTTATLVVIGIAIGCGEPAEPELPPQPDAGLTETSQTACFGEADGTPCGGAKICARGVCAEPSCGDGVVTAPEECDDGVLNAPGSGCEPTCTWTCVSTDPARSCDTENTCATSGTCDDAKHTCTMGGPKPTGASCGPTKYCRGAECVESVCGDAVVTPPEACDNGEANGPGTGCEASCKLSCVDPQVDCPPTPCNVATCSSEHRCATAPDASQNGVSCGAGLECKDGACIAPGAVCGNGVLEPGEECDLGAGNGPGTGCETVCKFSCTKAPDSCVDTNACRSAPTCETVTVDGKTGQRCVTGATKADGSTCGAGAICLSAVCSASVCGDGYRDDDRGEQCDDGNLTKLDACSEQCKFEQSHRVISMKMQFGTDAYCTVNRLGAAIGSLARTSFQSNIDEGIKDGSVSALFTLHGDLAGATGSVTVGNLSGTPPSNAPPYNGTSDLDWWYNPLASSIDATRTPRATLTGSYASSVLAATGRLNLITSIGGALASLAVSSAKIRMPIGASNVPTVATGNAPPGHVASEKLSPTLQSFATSGGTNLGSPTAQLCGNIAASSLDTTAPPESLLPGGDNACIEGYSSSNRLLDIIVNGCRVKQNILTVTAISASQPDQVDPSAPVAGAGGPYKLSVDPTTKRVTTCRDKNDAVVNLQTCLGAAAYSMSFKFATDRVIIK